MSAGAPTRFGARRAVLALALALLAPVLGGCGGNETPSEPPAQLLRAAAEDPPASGRAEIELHASLAGDSLLAGDAGLRLEGPFELGSPGEPPRFDFEMDAEVAGFGVDGQLVSIGDDAFVGFFGENYRVGAERFGEVEQRLRSAADRGEGVDLDPILWLEQPRYAGEDEVAGTAAERIEAGVRGDLGARDLAAFASAFGLPGLEGLRGAGGGSAEVWVAYDDRTIRRLRLEFPFAVPAELRALARGISGGSVTLDAEVSDVGAEVEIEPPAGGGFQPIEQLLRRLGDLASLGGL